MSDKTEREYRQNMLTILDRFYRGRGGSLLTKDECEAMEYAISSIKTDLKYDLLYEETTHIADNDKMIEPTADNDSAVDCIVDVLGSYTDLDIPYKREIAENILTKLPSVTPQEPRWIPVSEKLPNDRDWYLGIFKEPDTGWINPLPFICDYVGRETKATTKEHWILRGFTDRDYKECDYYYNLECVAWMPLPEPYKAETEG